jgi:MscS family membrane protein
VGVASDLLIQSPWARAYPASRALVPLGSRITRVGVVGIALVALLAELGYPVASLIAGLGIGGLAVALAAQKTLENMFGAFSIGVDQPFRVGDHIKVETVEGTVESIGLRSTRVRTPDRTVVTIPNGKLADMRIESLAARDRIRLHARFGLVHATRSEQLRAVLAGIEARLRAEPRIWPSDLVVGLKQISETSLELEVVAWFEVDDLEFRRIRQEVLLAIMEIVEKSGTRFALQAAPVTTGSG